jgi:hypothetical protein
MKNIRQLSFTPGFNRAIGFALDSFLTVLTVSSRRRPETIEMV